jgi:hypothetical protein
MRHKGAWDAARNRRFSKFANSLATLRLYDGPLFNEEKALD